MLSDQRERKKKWLWVCVQLYTTRGKSRQSQECVCGPRTLQLPGSQSRNLKIGPSACPFPSVSPWAHGLQGKNNTDPPKAPPALGLSGWDSALFLTTLETRRKLTQEPPSSPWTYIHTTPHPHLHIPMCVGWQMFHQIKRTRTYENSSCRNMKVGGPLLT